MARPPWTNFELVPEAKKILDISLECNPQVFLLHGSICHLPLISYFQIFSCNFCLFPKNYSRPQKVINNGSFNSHGIYFFLISTTFFRTLDSSIWNHFIFWPKPIWNHLFNILFWKKIIAKCLFKNSIFIQIIISWFLKLNCHLTEMTIMWF